MAIEPHIHEAKPFPSYEPGPASTTWQTTVGALAIERQKEIQATLMYPDPIAMHLSFMRSQLFPSSAKSMVLTGAASREPRPRKDNPTNTFEREEVRILEHRQELV